MLRPQKLVRQSRFQLWFTALDWHRYWLPILSRTKSGTEVNSHHRRLLDGAKAVDENVHSVLHRNSCIWREERRGCGVEFSFTAAWQHDWGSIVILQYATSSVMQYKKHFILYFCTIHPRLECAFDRNHCKLISELFLALPAKLQTQHKQTHTLAGSELIKPWLCTAYTPLNKYFNLRPVQKAHILWRNHKKEK